MTTLRAPKQWSLTKNETITSFESWRQNLIYSLSLDASFAPFLITGVTWLKKIRTNPRRGFTDDATGSRNGRTAAQKVAHLDLMLGQIANFCPVISRSTITKNSTSIDNIWQSIRAHYGFQSTGAHFIDLMNIKLKVDERPEDLYQRLMAFVEDSLLLTTSGLNHHGEAPTEDEELTPTLENLIVLFWLHLINSNLPGLVKQRYGTELRSRTLASIKPEISQAMDTLLETLQSNEEAKIMRAGAYQARQPFKQLPQKRFQRIIPTCPLCQSTGRQNSHYLSKCPFLPESDRKFISRARTIAALDQDDTNEEELESELQHQASAINLAPSSRRVQINKSPTISMYYHHHSVTLTLDSGAETNMIKESTAKSIGARISASTQTALQADGKTSLKVKGETKLQLTRENKLFVLEALVIEDIDTEILAGVPFMCVNDISLRPARSEIIFSDNTSYTYQNIKSSNKAHAIRNISAYLLRAPNTTVWPGEYIELDVPTEVSETEVALEPRLDNKSTTDEVWPLPTIIRTVAGKIRIPNLTNIPKVLKKNDHFAQTIPVINTTQLEPTSVTPLPLTSSNSQLDQTHLITIDENHQLPEDIRSKFFNLHREFHAVFNPSFKGYNGAFGPITATVNMGTVEPPQRKGRVPQYSHNKLNELQQMFDEFEKLGVFSKPEDLNIVAEYLNPSFLVKKPSGGYRLVTSFGEVARYSKPQPALMPDINLTLRMIGQWRHLIKTDLTQAFFQIPLAKASMKYCGVCTPFKGIRVYTRCAMGMPGSETALEELMSRVLGDLLQEGVVAKVADDLYCGGSTATELLYNWERVLKALQTADLNLSARKTVIAPKSTTILGWVWSDRKLTASPHRIATLSSCSLPTTIKALRSFLGAYKFLARVIPNCSTFLSPLETLVAGKPSQDNITWSESTRETFEHAQRHLHDHKSIIIPKPEDQLWLTTDGAVKSPGLGSTLYALREGKLHVAGYFSAKLKQRQHTWIPCEIEALSIATSLQHFAPYIIQSNHRVCVLTDSKPCVQAYAKLLRGQFSHSSRLSTFLSTASRFAAEMRHLAGTSNIPADFASRNAAECLNTTCQVCSFVNELQNISVNMVSADSIIKGSSKMPFITRSTWLTTQTECPDLRRVSSYLIQGTRPSKKLTNMKDTKRYLNCCTIAKDGMLIVPHHEPFSPVTERIVVPRHVLAGLLTALHIRLDHPSQFQLKKLFCRYFYALDLDSALVQLNDNCHICITLKKLPAMQPPAITTDPPPIVGHSFAADVIRRNKQFILLIRESVTSFTAACLIDSEDHTTLRDGLIKLCVELRPLDGPVAIVRTDPAPGFVKLAQDPVLLEHRISLETGRTKNINKNPVAEKAIQELQDEILRQDPDQKTLNQASLAVIVARLNSRIRNQGLSSRELWTQRDQFTHQQLPLDDQKLIQDQYHRRLAANQFRNQQLQLPHLKPISEGTLVYLKNERNKCHSRPRYLVVNSNGPWYNVRKFSGNQLRNNTYKVHLTEICTIPSNLPEPTRNKPPDDFEDEFINDQENGQPEFTHPPEPTVHKQPNVTTYSPVCKDRPPSPLTPEPHPPETPTHQPADVPRSSRQRRPPEPHPPETPTHQPTDVPRSSRQRRPPRYLDDYVRE